MLDYNNVSAIKKHIKTPNIGLGKFNCIKINMVLNYNLVKNT